MQQDRGNPNAGVPGSQSGTGLASNVAGALSYVLWLVTGIIFVLLEPKDQFVRFHAFQSILASVVWVVLSVALGIITAILGIIPVLGPILVGLIWLVQVLILGLGFFLLGLFLIYKAYQGEKLKLPYIGDMAEKYAASQSA